MINKNFKIISYKSSYFNKLKISYENSFNKLFISQALYEQRFSYHKTYSSYLLISNKDKVVGHIGFRIHNSNIGNLCKIAFRFSTFIIPSFRGGGMYLEFMNYVKNDLKNKFNVMYIYAWPNKINLLSCLKDENYINLNPIITWQHKLGNEKTSYEEEKIFKYKTIDFTNFDHIINKKEFGLTVDNLHDYKYLFVNRDNKEYKVISVEKNKYAILGISNIENKELISIIVNNELEIKFILNVLNMFHKYKKSLVQCWCFYKDRNLLRQLIKSNFKEDGPIFYNGVYELTHNRFPVNDYFPHMYNHDAF